MSWLSQAQQSSNSVKLTSSFQGGLPKDVAAVCQPGPKRPASWAVEVRTKPITWPHCPVLDGLGPAPEDVQGDNRKRQRQRTSRVKPSDVKNFNSRPKAFTASPHLRICCILGPKATASSSSWYLNNDLSLQVTVAYLLKRTDG